MSNNRDIEEIEKGWRSVYSIWIAMLTALFFYLIAGLFLRDKVSLSVEERTLEILRYVFYSLSIITIVSITFLRKMILRSGITGIMHGPISDNTAVAKYSAAIIFSLAFAETIAVYGLVLTLLGKNTTDLYILIFLSAATMIYYRPFKEQLIDMVNEKEVY